MPTYDAGAELSMALKNLAREFPGEGAKDGVLILEDRQRPPAGGAAGPYSGQLQALPRDLVPHVGQTVAIGALRKRSLAWRHVPFHLGLVLSVAGSRRADDEAPVLAGLYAKSRKAMDAIALARRQPQVAPEGFSLSAADPDIQEPPVALYHPLADSLVYAT